MRKADVLVRGLSGYNSRWARRALPWVLRGLARPPEVACVWFGANDASRGPQGVPLDEFEGNLTAMARDLRSAQGVRGAVLLLSPPPVDARAWPDRSLADAAAYARALRLCISAAGAPYGICTPEFVT